MSVILNADLEDIGPGAVGIRITNCGPTTLVSPKLRRIGGKGIVIDERSPDAAPPRSDSGGSFHAVKYPLEKKPKDKPVSKFTMGLISAVSAAGIAKALGWV